MAPEKQINLPEQMGNLPWYLMMVGAAAAKLEAVPMKLLVTILIGLVGGVSGFTLYRASDWANKMERKVDGIYQLSLKKGEVDHFQMTCINELRMKQGLQPVNIPPRLGGGELGQE